VVSVLYTLGWTKGGGLKVFRPSLGSETWPGWKGDVSNEVDDDVADAQLSKDAHPIEFLMEQAEQHFQELLATETTTLHDAAAQYRKTRHRHPPPGFEAWYAYAVESGAIVIESFWDQKYKDLTPFWSIDPVVLRKQTHVFSPKISIRDGEVEGSTNNAYEKLEIWVDMLRTLAKDRQVTLPDMDIPVNVNVEPAMLVPWETVDTAASMTRPLMLDLEEIVSEYTGLDDIDELTANFTFDPEWLGPRLMHHTPHLGPRPFWSLVRPACPPNSAARSTHVFNDIWDPEGGTSEKHSAAALLPIELPDEGLKGYVKSYTNAVDACRQPHLQDLHSAFVSPNAMSVTQKLFPLFGDSKLTMSSDILIPGANEWKLSMLSSESKSVSWEKRVDKLFWRGPATQSPDSARYWQRFQRERFVGMLNATHVEIAEASVHSGNESTVGVGYAVNFRVLPANEYHLKSQTKGQLAEWVNGWADAAFTNLHCNREEDCAYFREYFDIDQLQDAQQEAAAKYTAVVDGDGGDDSGELLRNLRNGKVILRASIYHNWYNSRLGPWLHFVPMGHTFVDLYGIMEYFLGTHVSEEARVYPHAVGEVQKHEHHFKTPSMEGVKEIPPVVAEDASQDGNEPHNFQHTHDAMTKRESDGHDKAARKTAETSEEWAKRVLRREDVLVYLYRLLLEYARILDDKRERLGWVEDLRKS
jgi:hypothetical protein